MFLQVSFKDTCAPAGAVNVRDCERVPPYDTYPVVELVGPAAFADTPPTVTTMSRTSASMRVASTWRFAMMTPI